MEPLDHPIPSRCCAPPPPFFCSIDRRNKKIRMRWKKWEETRGELITERSLPLAISGMNEFMLIMGLDRQRNALLISPRGLKH